MTQAVPSRPAPARPRRRSKIIGAFRQILRIYFRKVHVAGAIPAPTTGARLFAPNHVNGLIDPLLVLTTAECPISPIGKAPLWKIPILGMLLDAVGAVPVVRRRDDPTKAAGANDEIFEKVGSHLAGGGNVLIFPEGTSHNEPHLVRIRTGPARMLLAAYQADPSRITFQAVGLEFQARDEFRSRVLVLYGPERRVADYVVPDPERSVQAVTNAIESDLAALLVSGESWDERRLVTRVAELLANEAAEHERTFERASELARAVRDAGKRLDAKAPQAIDPVRTHVTAYFDALDRAGLEDLDVGASDMGHHVSERPLRRGTISPLAMFAMLPLAVVGTLLYAIPYRVPRLVARRAVPDVHASGGRSEGLTEQTDVVSTFKLATGILVFPIWALAAIGLSFWFLPASIAALVAVLVLASPLPALFWLDAVDDGLLRPSMPDVKLRAMRADALTAVERARSAIGG